MALVLTKMPREFHFEKDETTVKLPDPNPKFTVDEVIRFYSNQYPELTTATMEGPVAKNGKFVYSLLTTIGTKG